jgi:hypothetical protein
MNLWQKSNHDVAQNNFLSNFAPQMVGMWSAQHTPKVEQTTICQIIIMNLAHK